MPSPTSGYRRSAIIVASVAFLATAATVSAHDFWLVPNAFAVARGGELEVRGQTSTKFPTSLSAVAVDRVADARLIGASGEERIGDLSVSGKSLLLRQRPRDDGQRVVAAALVTRSSRVIPASLKRYIGLEGAPELAERYERQGAFAGTDSVVQETTKYAKTVVEVGSGGPRAYSRPAGHSLEFVPLTDPGAVTTGDVLAVRVLFRGHPLASAHLHAGWAPEGAVMDSAALPAGIKDQSLVTDASGVAHVQIDHAGLWNVRTLHAAPKPGANTKTWEVAFATLVFNAGNRQASAQGQGDSVAVVNTIEKFHNALAAGDSAGALSLLTADVVILESGGVETREEYRSHHLPGDIAFARAVKSARGPLRVMIRGDVAWAMGTSTTSGEYRGRQINSAGAELSVLIRTPEGWRISALHWSSRARRPAGG